MWKYIVMWTLIEMIPGGVGPTVDKYGRTSSGSLALCVFRKQETNHRMEFFKRNEALAFIENAPKQDTTEYSILQLDGYCDFAPLDSVWIEMSGGK